jgi:hypothetical protein
LHAVHKRRKEALWQQREGLDSMRASLESGLRRTGILLEPPPPLSPTALLFFAPRSFDSAPSDSFKVFSINLYCT